MQWPSFFDEKLLTNYGQGRSVPISRTYGFLWLFIAGVPWAGLAACMLAWCGSHRELRARDWCFRIGSGIAAAYLANVLYDHFPSVFLPLYHGMTAQSPISNPIPISAD